MSKTYIIAEAGVNHNGSFERAKELVRLASECGADAVKFQTFSAEALVARAAKKAAYQDRNIGTGKSQLEMLKELELTGAQFIELKKYCAENRIEFLSSPFDLGSVDFLIRECPVDKFKIPSGEITNAPFLLKIAQSKKPVILSTGMATLGDIESALAVLAFGYLGARGTPSRETFLESYFSIEGRGALKANVTVLHCTTEYPAPFDEVNLRAMDTIAEAFGLPVGYSDHTPGIAVSVAAVARGACMIEKHFTTDKTLPGPDHKASLTPAELREMVQAIRAVEVSIGGGQKVPTVSELPNRRIARKVLVAANDIRAGDVFSENNLTAKRLGDGISPMEYWSYIGKRAGRAYEKDEAIQP